MSGGGTRGEGGVATGPISGRVVLSDGADPEGIAVQRVCSRTVTAAVYTDSSGRFSLPRGAGSSSNTDAGANGNNSSVVGGCEVRASLAGYSADPPPLGGFDGVIVLHRIGAKLALTVSATTLLAPKEARKSYGKGLEAIRGNRPDEAQKDFAGAVKLYPRYAAAWLELGKVYEQRNHLSEARNAYSKSIGADAEYLYPYERLYHLDVQESKWQEAAAASAKVLRLDPYEFSEAYYFNAVSNLNLHDLDAAERSAREAVKLEGTQAEPRGNYVLGAILWHKGDLDSAAERMQAFLSSPSDGPERENARKMLAEIEKQIAGRQARAGK
jgi:tetratricopeptide (TPR) repeat protein